jgi:hypothetical protein
VVLCLWGCWTSRSCPRTYLPLTLHHRRAPSLRSAFTGLLGTMSSSDSLPAPRDFGLPLIRAVSRPTSGPPGRVSRVPPHSFTTCRRQYPGDVQTPLRTHRSLSVAFAVT